MNSENRSESVFRQFSAAIRGFILHHSSSSLSEAEDMLHDVFYKFMVADGEQQLIENVSAWLYRVTRNQIIDSSRKHREQKLPQAIEDNRPDESYETDPERQLASNIIIQEIEEALAALPPEQRTVFELNELQGITLREISKSTGIPLATLTTRKRYAVEKLRHSLASLYDSLFE